MIKFISNLGHADDLPRRNNNFGKNKPCPFPESSFNKCQNCRLNSPCLYQKANSPHNNIESVKSFEGYLKSILKAGQK